LRLLPDGVEQIDSLSSLQPIEDPNLARFILEPQLVQSSVYTRKVAAMRYLQGLALNE
jgi:hypothetical protein